MAYTPGNGRGIMSYFKVFELNLTNGIANNRTYTWHSLIPIAECCGGMSDDCYRNVIMINNNVLFAQLQYYAIRLNFCELIL